MKLYFSETIGWCNLKYGAVRKPEGSPCCRLRSSDLLADDQRPVTGNAVKVTFKRLPSLVFRRFTRRDGGLRLRLNPLYGLYLSSKLV